MVVCTCSPSYSGGWGRRITWTREAEVVVSRDCATALQPGWQRETLPLKKKLAKIPCNQSPQEVESIPLLLGPFLALRLALINRRWQKWQCSHSESRPPTMLLPMNKSKLASWKTKNMWRRVPAFLTTRSTPVKPTEVRKPSWHHVVLRLAYQLLPVQTASPQNHQQINGCCYNQLVSYMKTANRYIFLISII